MSVNRSMATPALAGAARALSANLARSSSSALMLRLAIVRPASPDARARLVPATVLAGDALLVQLAAARRVLDGPLARAAALALAHRAWIYCGYKSQGDYTRECLHRHPRWLRDRAQQQDKRSEVSQAVEPAGSGADDAAHEDRVLVRQMLPPDVKLAFETVFELHRSIVGREASPSEFVEGLVGEAMSAGCIPPHDFEPRLRFRSSRVLHSDRAPVASTRCGERTAAFETHRRLEPSSARPVLAASGLGQVPPALQTPALRLATRRLAEFERLGARLRRLELKLLVVERCQTNAAPEVPSGKCLAAIPRTRRRDLRRLGGILASLLRLENELDIAIGDLLLELHEHHAWRTLDVAGLEAYAEARLGLGRATARRRVWLARALRKQHVVRTAYEAGDIGFMAACWVARSLQRIQADAATQKLWVAHAAQTTHKRQRDEERCRERERLRTMIAVGRVATPEAQGKRATPQAQGKSATTDGAEVSTSCIAGTSADPDVNVNATCDTRSSAVLSGATIASAVETAHFSPRPQKVLSVPMADASWHATIRRVPGEACYEVFTLGHGLLERIERGGPQLQVPLHLELDAFDATNLSGCVEAARREMGARVAGSLRPDDECRLGPAARLARTFVDRGQRVPDWVGLLALLEEYALAHDRPQKRGQRSPVAERDGYRCGAPGCSSRQNLQEHHLQYRSHQGGDEETNLLLLCAFHHLQGEHGGLVRCRGQAPLDVVWRLGLDEFAIWFWNEKRLDVT